MIYAKLLGVALLWAGTFIAGKYAAPQLPHFTLAALRFWCAAAFLVPALLWTEQRFPRLSARTLALTAVVALFGLFAYNLFFFGALELIPAGRTALVVALNPILTAVAMALVFRERIAGYRWLGIVLALAGVWIVISKGEPWLILQRIGPGELLMFGGAASWATHTITSRFVLTAPDAPSPLAATTLVSLWGALMLSVGMPFEWSQWTFAQVDPGVWATILYFGAGGTALAFVWYNEGVRQLGASRTSVFNNMVPVFGVLLATLILDEPLLVSMVVGGLVALAGVSLTNWQRGAARAP
jgi:drug/metabolite transporter (DMT)-like permease